MENNSDLNNQAAQYTLCFNTRCPKAENCLRHSMTQYTTAQNIRLSVINPLCYPAAGKECPHFRSNKKIRVAWGFKKLYDDMPARISRAIHLNLEAIFNHSPYYRYRNQKLGLTPKQQECIRQVCRKHGWKEEIQVRPVHRGRRTGKHFVGIPPQGSRHSTTGYLNYRQVVQGIFTVVALVPRSGTRRTLVRYFSYQTVVRTVPSKEIYWYMHTTDRQQSTQYEFTNIFSLSLFPVSAGLYKTET